MNSFHPETTLVGDPVVNEVVEVSSLIMRRVRCDLRHLAPDALSFTQTRAMAYLRHAAGASVSEVAEFLGLGVPTASKVIDELAQQGLVERTPAAHDRRRVELRATPAGLRAFAATVAPAYEAVAELLAPLSAAEREVVERAMALLHPLLEPGSRGDDE